MKLHIIAFFLLFQLVVYGQDKSFVEKEISTSRFVDGTLLIPANNPKPDLAILIGDSGPVNRDGNQNFLKNNSLKKLAEGLSSNGVATFRYDKRTAKQIKMGYIDDNILFDDLIVDAKSVINYFKSGDNFNRIFIIGHGQGSLVAMIAVEGSADGFISIGGAGKSIDNVIIEQVEKTAPTLSEEAIEGFKLLRDGKPIYEYPEALESIFNRENQPFMMNWMQYDPVNEIKKLHIPILIINGTKDLQVSVEESSLLNQASSSANLKIIDKMNHVMFIIQGDELENSKSYNESFRKISPELIESILGFINKKSD